MHYRTPTRRCEAVKARSLPACTKCDYKDLPAVCSSPEGRAGESFVRTCHAGADEVLLPLWNEGVLVAVLFVGQVTRATSAPRGPIPLRFASDDDIQHVQNLALALRSYLLGALRRLDAGRRERPSGRCGTIQAYIHESLSTGPTLAGLASRLSLSRSRAGHVVRELTGRSFQDHVEERRIAVAKDLLTSTDATIAWVAHHTGFKDPSFFFRYFEHKTGTTPTTFRKRYRRDVSV